MDGPLQVYSDTFYATLIATWYMIVLMIWHRRMKRKAASKNIPEYGGLRVLLAFFAPIGAVYHFDPIYYTTFDQQVGAVIAGLGFAVALAHLGQYLLGALKRALRRWLGQSQEN